MQTATKYFGHYTASEYALVKGELIQKFQEVYSQTTVDSICRYLAKHNWPKERKDSYTAAFSQPNPTREASLMMLHACDTGQELFDRLRHGENYVRTYETVPGLEDEQK